MTPEPAAAAPDRELVLVRVDGVLFGLDIADVREVFHPQATSPVPLTGPEVSGLLNLRGRIVTAVCARRRLGLPPRPADARPPMAVGLDRRGESYGLLVDSVEEVLALPAGACEPAPANLDPRWAGVTRGVCRLPEGLLVVLDVGRLLDLGRSAAA